MNCLYITLFFNIVASIVQTFIMLEPASVSTSHRCLPPVLWTTLWLDLAPHHCHLTFSQGEVYLGEETSGNHWAWGLDCMVDGPIYPTWIFQKRSGDVRGMGPRVVMEQAHAAWQHSSPFVLNGLLKPCQGVRICSSINCCTRKHEVDQENAFSVPENRRNDFFHWDLKFWIFWFWGSASGSIPMTWLDSGVWWKARVSSSVAMESRNSSPTCA